MTVLVSFPLFSECICKYLCRSAVRKVIFFDHVRFDGSGIISHPDLRGRSGENHPPVPYSSLCGHRDACEEIRNISPRRIHEAEVLHECFCTSCWAVVYLLAMIKYKHFVEQFEYVIASLVERDNMGMSQGIAHCTDGLE